MRTNKVIKTIALNWRKKLWGFYDLQFMPNDLPVEINAPCGCSVFSCGYIGKMTMCKGGAGLVNGKYHYQCPNCLSKFDANYKATEMKKLFHLNPNILK